MKKIFILLLLIGYGVASNAQTGQAELLSDKIAKKMSDTLSLTQNQRSQIYATNMLLHKQKENIWRQFENQDSLLNVHIQRIENTRDSLYKPILGDVKYLQYKQKKRYLISNN